MRRNITEEEKEIIGKKKEMENAQAGKKGGSVMRMRSSIGRSDHKEERRFFVTSQLALAISTMLPHMTLI